VEQIKSTSGTHNSEQVNDNRAHATPQHTHNTHDSNEFDDFVNKIEEIKAGSPNKHSTTTKAKSLPVHNANTNNVRDPHHYYWDFLNTTPNPEPMSSHTSSRSDPHYYYWDFLSQTNTKRRGSWAVKPTGTGRRGSVTSGEFRAQHHLNTQSTQ